MPNKEQMTALAREAFNLVKEKAPTMVDEIISDALDQVAIFSAELLTQLSYVPDDEKAIVMAHGIIRDGLLTEIMDQLKTDMLADADKRITTLFGEEI